MLEKKLNKIFCGGHPVIFSSLHLAHLSVLPLLGSSEMPSFPMASDGIHFILDKTVHASIQINRALLAQFGEVSLIDVSNNDALTTAFEHSSYHKKTPIIVADSVGSMGGLAPINKILTLCDKYKGYAYLDDAHGTSIYGQHGCGYVLEKTQGTFHPRLILVASLSKAFGSVASVVVLPQKEDANTVKHFGPTYVFGGPPALPVIDAAIASSDIHLSIELQALQNTLWKKVNYFDDLIQDSTLTVINLGRKTPIRGLLVGDEFDAIAKAKHLQHRGHIVTTAMYPTVKRNQAMLRIAISSLHEPRHIDELCSSAIAIFKGSI